MNGTFRNWSSKQLGTDYDRLVSGFDIKKVQRGSDNNYHISADADYLPSEINEDIKDWLSLNDLFALSLNGLGNEIRILAFDLPKDLVGLLKPLFFFEEIDMSFLNPNEKMTWDFLGFDVLAVDTLFSGLYMSLYPDQQDFIFKSGLNEQRNQYGLISDESQAIIWAQRFSEMIPEHSPFAPCGIWMNSQPVGRGTKPTFHIR
ncbi:MAG: hypothetical protein KGO49_14560 [Gammaproteobacteria bacterium]|nr:hypothetical protein [Gammaproteobacteria bacterium]